METERATSGAIDQILSQVYAPEGNMVDATFEQQFGAIYYRTNKIRRAEAFPKLTTGQWAVTANQHHLMRLLYRDETRKNGEPVENHPLGALRMLEEKMHLTGPTSKIVILGHDNIEDKKQKPEQIFEWRRYTDLMPAEELQAMSADVGRYVIGLTKVKELGTSKAEARRNAKETLLRVASETDIKVILYKLADVLHNLSTLDAHEEDHKIVLAREIESIFLLIAHRCRLLPVAEYITQELIRILNRPLHDQYEMLKGEKKDLQRQQKELLGKWWKEQRITEASMQSDALSILYPIERGQRKKPLAELTMDDLVITPDDSLLDFEILTKLPQHSERIKNSLIKNLAGGRNYEEIPLGSLRGTLLRIWTKQGIVTVIINSKVMAARSRRGILAHTESGALPAFQQELREAVEQVEQNRITIGKAINSLFERKQMNFTPQGDKQEISVGGTALEFAFTIHPDLMIGAQEAHVSSSILKSDRHKASLFEPLPPGSYVEVESCLQKGRNSVPDNSKIQVDPSWFVFCGKEGGKILSDFMRKNYSDEELEKIGAAFLDRICRTFTVLDSYFMEGISQEEVGPRNVRESKKREKIIYKKLATGEIDPLSLVEKIYNESDRSMVQVDVTEIGSLGILAPEKWKGIEIQSNTLQTYYDEEKRRNFAQVPVTLTHGTNLRDFFKTVLRFSNEGYNIRIYALPKSEPPKALKDSIAPAPPPSSGKRS